MTVPSQVDIQKRKKNADQLRKKITEDGFLTEKELVRIVRKAIDSAWMTSANKLVFLEDRVIPDMNDLTRTKWLIKCDHCGKLFKLGDIQIDHVVGEFQCKIPADFESYIINRLCVGFKDMQVLCKEDHLNKTYAERHGVSIEEATYQRIAISLEKKKMDKEYIKSKGFEPIRNPQKRRQQLVEILKEEKEKEDE